ncbi:unnamed protein product [Adineta steineri]|uniref:LicD/FKTN/FKRP nucleotidyltransferase domain-containing protein n=1 Tax=Adineta steineri TaxID=433720 RepID=A0A813NS86_9BILA|nr:unnamed protein product [Adineta steineri]CAF0741891.1 unnamed protein product [Adineta steineri]CAF3560518.1 unnamed protein product [Adineta steineri]CAF3656119.1 unnamed protein product [Adineta steineri]
MESFDVEVNLIKQKQSLANIQQLIPSISIMNTPRFLLKYVYATVLLFILFMAIYYPKNNTNYTDFTQATNYSVEDALDHVPTCNSNDRSRQRCYWIAYGTLIGYVQRGGLIPHDHDADVLILAQDTQYLVPFSNANFSSAYEIKVHPQWSTIIDEKKRSYFRSEGINFVAPNARYIDRKLHYHVDIWPTYEFHPDQSTNITYFRKTLTDYDNSYNWVSSPMNWTFPLKPCMFSGIKVWCPAMPERIVTMVYGVGSINKTDRKCVNGTWINV